MNITSEQLSNELKKVLTEFANLNKGDLVEEVEDVYTYHLNNKKIASVFIIRSENFSCGEIINHPNYNPNLVESKGNPLHDLNPHEIVISKEGTVFFNSNYELDISRGEQLYIDKIRQTNNNQSDLINALDILLK